MQPNILRPVLASDVTTSTVRLLAPALKNELRLLWTKAVSLDTNAIGWLPTSAFDARAEQDDISVIYRNGDLVGWAMHSPSLARAVEKIYQIWVRPDARTIEHGRALVNRICNRAKSTNCVELEAWVAEDLAANLFWRAIGFTATNWRYGRGERGRRHTRWVAPIGAKTSDNV